MYDYVKMRVNDLNQIDTILNNPKLEFHQSVNRSTSELFSFPQKAQFKEWD